MKKPKILLISSINSYNFGAVLQAYSLSKFLMDKNLQTTSVYYNYKNYSIIPKLKFNGFKVFLNSLFNVILTFLNLVVILKKRSKFRKFILENVKDITFVSNYKNLQNLSLGFNIFLVGSDQMFNYKHGYNKVNFLDFGSPEVLRTSYATSLGNNDLDDKNAEIIIEKLNEFDYLSLREPISNNLFNNSLKYCVNIDPSFLLPNKDLIKMIQPVKFTNYVLVYSLLPNNILEEVISYFSGFKKVILISENLNLNFSGCTIIKNVGPIDFLSLIYYADFVVSTSYHGVCYSIKFNKQFISLISNKEKRITNLLNFFNLSERIIYNKDLVKQLKDIDYSKINNLIGTQIEQSNQYFNEIVNNEEL